MNSSQTHETEESQPSLFSKVLKYLGFFLVFLIILGVLVSFWFLYAFLVPPKSLRVLLLLFAFICLVRFIRRVLLFPGHFTILKWHFEQNYGAYLSEYYLNLFGKIESVAFGMGNQLENPENLVGKQEFEEIRIGVSTLLQVLRKLSKKKGGNGKNWLKFRDLVQSLGRVMKETEVLLNTSGENTSFWDIFLEWKLVLGISAF